ncbi:hypothetical protein KRMM14A1004_26260 [Krasilnikovia sp. MM14-A1004]
MATSAPMIATRVERCSGRQASVAPGRLGGAEGAGMSSSWDIREGRPGVRAPPTSEQESPGIREPCDTHFFQVTLIDLFSLFSGA